MPRDLRRNIETVTQVVIAVAVLVVGGVVVKRYLFPPPTQMALALEQAQLLKGTRMIVPNVNWEKNRKSLVFFLRKDCAYCKTAAPFYRELIDEAAKRDVKFLSILPDTIEEGKKYVQSLDLPIEDVQMGSLSSYKIPATPSVLFVDHLGMIRSVWVGANPAQQNEMRNELMRLFDARE
jgi:peroxiredoxin